MSLEGTCQLDDKSVEKPFLPYLFAFKNTVIFSFYTRYELSKMGEIAECISYHCTQQLFLPSDQNCLCLHGVCLLCRATNFKPNSSGIAQDPTEEHNDLAWRGLCPPGAKPLPGAKPECCSTALQSSVQS